MGIMISLLANPFRESLKRVGPENRDFLGLELAMSEPSAIWAQKSREFQGLSLPMALEIVGGGGGGGWYEVYLLCTPPPP
jgi:hypothetical protein